jgi:hypothetical protein
VIRKIKLVALWSFISIFLILTFFLIWHPDFKNSYPEVSFTPPADYAELFTDSAKAKLILEENYSIKGRNSFSIFEYDHKYNLLVYKISVLANKNLDSLISQDRKGIRRPISGITTLSVKSILRFTYSDNIVPDKENIMMTFYVDSPSTTFRSKHMITGKMNMDHIIVSYKKSGSVDFIVESPEGVKIPTGIVFLKTGENLYLIFVNGIDCQSCELLNNPKQLLKSIYY